MLHLPSVEVISDAGIRKEKAIDMWLLKSPKR